MSEPAMPQYYIPVDDDSIERAIAAVSELMQWPYEREGTAELLVAAVWKALESPPSKQEQSHDATV